MNVPAKIVVLVVMLAAVGGVLAIKQHGVESVTGAAAASDGETTTAWPKAAPLPRLVDLGAGKCIPCKAMAPILAALRQDFHDQFQVTFIDIWEDQAAGEAYGVRMIPTQIFFDAEGNELFRHEGFYSREEILGKWRELGYSFDAVIGPEVAS